MRTQYKPMWWKENVNIRMMGESFLYQIELQDSTGKQIEICVKLGFAGVSRENTICKFVSVYVQIICYYDQINVVSM